MNKIVITFFFTLISVHGKAQCTPVLDLPFTGNPLDVSGNLNHGIASGTPTLTADRFGNPNSAYDFGGVGDVDFFTVTNSSTLQFSNQLSVSYWFKQCSFGGMDGWGQTVTYGNHVIMAKAGDGIAAQPGFWNSTALNGATNQLTWNFCNKNGYPASTLNFCQSTTFNCFNLCEWVHVAVVVDGTNMKTYINGILTLNQTINMANFTVANTKPLYIGKMDGIWYPFRGTIDDIKIYNCAISSATVSSLYGSFSNPLNTNITPTFNPVGPICNGGALPTLSTTSLNGISGTWSPAINNTTATTYVFTPNAGQCANSTSLTINVVNSMTTPTFTQVTPICSGQTLSSLPTTSLNGITGTWSPAINNTATTTYTFTPNVGQCASTASMTIVVNSSVTPTFSQVSQICSGATLSALPTTSLNGVTGSWSPALNNTATTTYTFTPNVGQCASTASMTIVVNSSVTPTFSQVVPICSGATLSALPTTSLNGVTGSWSPALNNTATTTYTFTPNVGQCASTASMTIVVNSSVTPTFSQVAPICSGATLSALPTTSLNGVTGSWSPAINNTGTTTYTFTPSVGQCASTTSMTIVVNSSVTPTFTQVAPICSGQTLSSLPTTSLNGITGTWTPALNNTATTTHTFTPSIGQCASTASMTIVVNSSVTPTFTQVAPICSGATLSALPTTSLNGVTGSWSPALNNTATTTYTFTPNVGQCASTASMTIVVNSSVTPTFAQIAPICSGATLSALPSTSINGITGTWAPPLSNTVTTTYTFTPTSVSNGGVCSFENTMDILVIPNITPTFDPVLPICEGAPLGSLPTISLESFDGSWSPAPNNSLTTTYTFSPNPNPNLCLVNATLTITVNPNITPTFTQVTDICEGQSLNPFPTTSINGYTGVWSPQPNENETTTYTFDPDPLQCALQATMEVAVNPLPIPSFTVAQETGCVPLEATFTNTSVGALHYQWNFGNGANSTVEQPTATYTIDGCYDITLTATDNLGCSASLTMSDLVCVIPAPEAFFTSSIYTLNENELTSSFFNQSANASWFSWDFGDGTPTVEAFETTHLFPSLDSSSYTVTLTATNEAGCIDSYSFTYEFIEDLVCYIPNAFTPDGDQNNHSFLPIFTSGFDPLGYNLKIYNRWGEVIFESYDSSVGWDGMYDGIPMKSDLYSWQISIRNQQSVMHKLSGFVNLLK